MNKIVIIISFIFTSLFASGQDLNRTTFITDEKQILWLFEDSKVSKLNEEELNQVEQMIISRIYQRNSEVGKKNAINMHEYFRQYIVVENAIGEKEVWINFLCDISGSNNWKTNVIMVSDGGKCYFNMTVNLTTNKVSRFVVNGLG